MKLWDVLTSSNLVTRIRRHNGELVRVRWVRHGEALAILAFEVSFDRVEWRGSPLNEEDWSADDWRVWEPVQASKVA